MRANVRPGRPSGRGLSVALLCALAGCLGTRQPRGKPSVVLISIDTLRADRLSVYGYERPTTPHLERLARDGVVFDTFYYPGGATLPSHMTMLTSLGVVTHDVTPRSKRVLEKERITLAEQLREQGYETAAFVDGGWMSGRFGFDQGFDVYDDEGGHFERTLPRAFAWLRERAPERPLFLFLHTYDVHSKAGRQAYDCPGDYPRRYADPSAFDGCRGALCGSRLLLATNQAIRNGETTATAAFSPDEIRLMSDRYDGCINYVDDRIGEIVAELRRQGRYDDGVVVVTSDHGEEFADHGLFSHIRGGYEEIARIPLIVKLPGGALAARRSPALSSTLDVMPTILDALGIEPNPDVQGRSLLPLVEGREDLPGEVDMGSIYRAGRFKLISRVRGLYDLEADPEERNNLYDVATQTRDDLTAKLEAIVARRLRARAQFEARIGGAGPPGIDLSDEERSNLRALGYAVD